MDLYRQAIFLSIFTIVYNLIEGVVSLYFGISDGAVSLAGFGGDSLIEVGSAAIVLWRFRDEEKERSHSLDKERAATFGIGLLFAVLSLVTIVASMARFSEGIGPRTTIPGLVISLLSLSFMFYLWKAKARLAVKLDSSTMMSDARCSLACIKLSVVLLAGSGVVYFAPSLWWAEPLSALVLALLIGQEGWETIQTARDKDFTGGCCS